MTVQPSEPTVITAAFCGTPSTTQSLPPDSSEPVPDGQPASAESETNETVQPLLADLTVSVPPKLSVQLWNFGGLIGSAPSSGPWPMVLPHMGDVCLGAYCDTNASSCSSASPSVIVDACAEVRGPLGYATAVIALAVLPIALLTGIGGAFSRPLVGTYLLAVGAALLVALTVTPALAYLLLSGPPRKPWSSPRTGRTWRATRWYLGRPGWAYATVGLFLLSGLALLPQLGNHPVVPQLRDRNLVVQWQAAAGTSLSEMDALTLDASRQLRQIPGVRTVAGEVGRTLISDRVADVNSGQLWVTLDPAADYDRSVAAIRQVADNMPALTHTVSTYADQRLREVTAQTPGTPVTVRLYGQDLATLANRLSRKKWRRPRAPFARSRRRAR